MRMLGARMASARSFGEVRDTAAPSRPAPARPRTASPTGPVVRPDELAVDLERAQRLHAASRPSRRARACPRRALRGGAGVSRSVGGSSSLATHRPAVARSPRRSPLVAPAARLVFVARRPLGERRVGSAPAATVARQRRIDRRHLLRRRLEPARPRRRSAAVATLAALRAVRRVGATAAPDRPARSGFQRERRRRERRQREQPTTTHAPDAAEPAVQVERDEAAPQAGDAARDVRRRAPAAERRSPIGSSATTPSEEDHPRAIGLRAEAAEQPQRVDAGASGSEPRGGPVRRTPTSGPRQAAADRPEAAARGPARSLVRHAPAAASAPARNTANSRRTMPASSRLSVGAHRAIARGRSPSLRDLAIAGRSGTTG